VEEMTPPELIVNDGPSAGTRLEVVSEIFLGREGCDLTFEDPQLSRRHAVVRLVDGTVEIEDLGSLNGTWVNGTRIDKAKRVVSGDAIRIGQTRLSVELAEPDPSLTVLDASAPATSGTVLADAPPPPASLPASPGPTSIPVPATSFAPPGLRPRGRAASRRLGFEVFTFATIVATAAALLLYFALR
jgi:pSer/pThr/pTyr-binding forkhead associated (FHA) protein